MFSKITHCPRNLIKVIIVLIPIAIFSSVAFFKEPHKPQIYDCFLFFNELELLEVRLSEMYDQVDKFVLVEASETFRGKPKPLYFPENRHLFEKYVDKIIHIIISKPFIHDNPWHRERFQRQQIMRGLKDCHRNDIIFLSDLDEIVKNDRIPEIAKRVISKKSDAVVCEQKMYVGHLNRYMMTWNGTTCTSFKKFKSLPVRRMRSLRKMTPRSLSKAGISRVFLMENAGWHFNSMGGLDRYITKLKSFSHKELDTPEISKEKRYIDVILSAPPAKIDDSYPLFIQENQEYFEKIGFIFMDRSIK